MTVCINCGVELDDGLTVCPLCGKNQVEEGGYEYIPENYPSEIIQLHKKENRKHIWELSGIIAFSGITVCTIIDLVTNRSLSWSLISDVSILAAWIIMTIFLFINKKPLISVALLMLTILPAVFFINLFAAGKEWFFPVGIPITFAAFIAAGAIIILYRAAHFKGLNIFAAALIILSGFCIIIEMILDKYLDGIINLRWSLITAVSIFPVALIFFFYHYRLKKGNRLDSFFHI
jgi:hypothetical protein